MRAAVVTHDYFTTLGIAPRLGRFLSADDFQPGAVSQLALTAADYPPGAVPGLVLTEGAWQRWFGQDPAVLGRLLDVSGPELAGRYEIVGVTPRDAELAQFGTPDFYVPAPASTIRSLVTGLHVVARLKPEIPVGHARAHAAASTERLRRGGPESGSPTIELSDGTARVRASRPIGHYGLAVDPLHDAEVGHLRRPLGFLQAAALLVLVAAGTNAAGLLLAGGLARARELSVRMAMGAARARIVRLLFIEHVFVAAAALAIATTAVPALVPLLVHAAPPDLPRLYTVRIDQTALWVAAATTAGTLMLFGVLPAVLMSRLHPGRQLSGSTATTDRSAWRHGLLAGQVLLVAALLVPSALLGRTLWTLLHAPLGFSADGLVALRVVPGRAYANDSVHATFMQDLVRRTAQIARAKVVVTSELPATPFGLTNVSLPLGSVAATLSPVRRSVTPDYLSLLGIPIVDGRGLRDDDAATGGVVVNQTFARYLPAPIVGQRFTPNSFTSFIVVGVAGDVRELGVREAPVPAYYCVVGGVACTHRAPWIVARTSAPPDQFGAMVQAVLRDLDPAVPVAEVTTLGTHVQRAQADVRFIGGTLIPLALAGIALLALGVIAVVQYQVTRDRREIGIRLAIGGPPAIVGWSIARRIVLLVAAGSVAGLVAGLGAAGLLQTYLFDMTPTDPAALLIAGGALLVTGAAAAYLPARRATRLDPVKVLREA